MSPSPRGSASARADAKKPPASADAPASSRPRATPSMARATEALQGAALLRTSKGLYLVTGEQLSTAARSPGATREAEAEAEAEAAAEAEAEAEVEAEAEPEAVAPKRVVPSILATLPEVPPLPSIPPLPGISCVLAASPPILDYSKVPPIHTPLDFNAGPSIPTGHYFTPIVTHEASDSFRMMNDYSQRNFGERFPYNRVVPTVTGPCRGIRSKRYHPPRTEYLSPYPDPFKFEVPSPQSFEFQSPQPFKYEYSTARDARFTAGMHDIAQNPYMSPRGELTSEATPTTGYGVYCPPPQAFASPGNIDGECIMNSFDGQHMSAPLIKMQKPELPTTLFFKSNFAMRSSSTQTNVGVDLSAFEESEKFRSILPTEIIECEVTDIRTFGTQTEKETRTCTTSSVQIHERCGVLFKSFATQTTITTFEAKKTLQTQTSGVNSSVESKDSLKLKERRSITRITKSSVSCECSSSKINELGCKERRSSSAQAALEKETCCAQAMEAHSVYLGTAIRQLAHIANDCVHQLFTVSSSARSMVETVHARESRESRLVLRARRSRREKEEHRTSSSTHVGAVSSQSSLLSHLSTSGLPPDLPSSSALPFSSRSPLPEATSSPCVGDPDCDEPNSSDPSAGRGGRVSRRSATKRTFSPRNQINALPPEKTLSPKESLSSTSLKESSGTRFKEERSRANSSPPARRPRSPSPVPSMVVRSKRTIPRSLSCSSSPPICLPSADGGVHQDKAASRRSELLFRRSRQMVWRITNKSRAFRNRVRRMYFPDEIPDTVNEVCSPTEPSTPSSTKHSSTSARVAVPPEPATSRPSLSPSSSSTPSTSSSPSPSPSPDLRVECGQLEDLRASDAPYPLQCKDHLEWLSDAWTTISTQDGNASHKKKHHSPSWTKLQLRKRSTSLRSSPEQTEESGSSKKHHSKKTNKKKEKVAQKSAHRGDHSRLLSSSAKTSTTVASITSSLSVSSAVSEKQHPHISDEYNCFDDVLVKILETKTSDMNIHPPLVDLSFLDNGKTLTMEQVFKTKNVSDLSVACCNAPIMLGYDETTMMSSNTKGKGHDVIHTEDKGSEKIIDDNNEYERIEIAVKKQVVALPKAADKTMETEEEDSYDVTYPSESDSSLYEIRPLSKPLGVIVEALENESRSSHLALSKGSRTVESLLFIDTKTYLSSPCDSEQFHKPINTETFHVMQVGAYNDPELRSKISLNDAKNRLSTYISPDETKSLQTEEHDLLVGDELKDDCTEPVFAVGRKTINTGRSCLWRRRRCRFTASPLARTGSMRQERQTTAAVSEARTTASLDVETSPAGRDRPLPPGAPRKAGSPMAISCPSSSSSTLSTVTSAPKVAITSDRNPNDSGSQVAAITCDSSEEVTDQGEGTETSLVPATEPMKHILTEARIQNADTIEETSQCPAKTERPPRNATASVQTSTNRKVSITPNIVQTQEATQKLKTRWKVEVLGREKSGSPSRARVKQANWMTTSSLPESSVFPPFNTRVQMSSSSANASPPVSSSERSVKSTLPLRPRSIILSRSPRSSSPRPPRRFFSVASSDFSFKHPSASSNTPVRFLSLNLRPKHKPGVITSAVIENQSASTDKHRKVHIQDSALLMSEVHKPSFQHEHQEQIELFSELCSTSSSNAHRETPVHKHETSTRNQSEPIPRQRHSSPFKRIASGFANYFQNDSTDHTKPPQLSSPQITPIHASKTGSSSKPEISPNIPQTQQKHVVSPTPRSRVTFITRRRPSSKRSDSPSPHTLKSQLRASGRVRSAPLQGILKTTSKINATLSPKNEFESSSKIHLKPPTSSLENKTNYKNSTENKIFQNSTTILTSSSAARRRSSKRSQTPSSERSLSNSSRSDSTSSNKSTRTRRLKGTCKSNSRGIPKKNSNILRSSLQNVNALQEIHGRSALSSASKFLRLSRPVSVPAPSTQENRATKKRSQSFDSTTSRESNPVAASNSTSLSKNVASSSKEPSLCQLLPLSALNNMNRTSETQLSPSCDKIIQTLLTDAIGSLRDLMISGVIDEQKTVDATAAVAVAMSAARSALASGKPLLLGEKTAPKPRSVRARAYRPLDKFRKHRQDKVASADSNTRRHNLTDRSSLISFASLTQSGHASSSSESSPGGPKSEPIARPEKIPRMSESEKKMAVKMGAEMIPNVASNQKKMCKRRPCDCVVWEWFPSNDNARKRGVNFQSQRNQKEMSPHCLPDKVHHTHMEKHMVKNTFNPTTKEDLRTCSQQENANVGNNENNDKVCNLKTETNTSNDSPVTTKERKPYLTRRSITAPLKLIRRTAVDVKPGLKADVMHNSKCAKKTPETKTDWREGAIKTVVEKARKTNQEHSTDEEARNVDEISKNNVKPFIKAPHNRFKRPIINRNDRRASISSNVPRENVIGNVLSQGRKSMRLQSRHLGNMKREETYAVLLNKDDSGSSAGVIGEPVKTTFHPARSTATFSRLKPSVEILHKRKKVLSSHSLLSDMSYPQSSDNETIEIDTIKFKSKRATRSETPFQRNMSEITNNLSPIKDLCLVNACPRVDKEPLLSEQKSDRVSSSLTKQIFPTKPSPPQIVPTPKISVASGEISRKVEKCSVLHGQSPTKTSSTERRHQRVRNENVSFSEESTSNKPCISLEEESTDGNNRHPLQSSRVETLGLEEPLVEANQDMLVAAVEEIFQRVTDMTSWTTTRSRSAQESQRGNCLDKHPSVQPQSPTASKQGKPAISAATSDNAHLNSFAAFASFINSRISDLETNTPAPELQVIQPETKKIFDKKEDPATEGKVAKETEADTKADAKTEVGKHPSVRVLLAPQPRGQAAYASAFSVASDLSSDVGSASVAEEGSIGRHSSEESLAETSPGDPNEQSALLQALAMELGDAQTHCTPTVSAPTTAALAAAAADPAPDPAALLRAGYSAVDRPMW